MSVCTVISIIVRIEGFVSAIELPKTETAVNKTSHTKNTNVKKKIKIKINFKALLGSGKKLVAKQTLLY